MRGNISSVCCCALCLRYATIMPSARHLSAKADRFGMRMSVALLTLGNNIKRLLRLMAGRKCVRF